MIPIKRKALALGIGGTAILVLLSLAICARPSGPGVYRVVRLPPFVTLDIGSKSGWIVQSGVNVVSDTGRGMPGNVIEFPVAPGYRMGITYYSKRWSKEAHAR